MINYVLDVINKNEDHSCTRLACGLLTDIANSIESNICHFLDLIIPALLKVLEQPEYETETKVTAIIALGDIIMQSGEHYDRFLEQTMTSMFAASNYAV